MSDLPIRAVLDTTAVSAYGHGSVDVGEIIAEITDEGAGFAVPDLCLIEAAHLLDSDNWAPLELLVGHTRCVRLALSADWRDVAAAARLLHGVSRAAAMLAAVDYGAYLLTTEANVYGEDAPLIIEV